jgi:hypothetical protein
MSEYLKYLPALGRLGATDLVRRLFSNDGTPAAEDLPQP